MPQYFSTEPMKTSNNTYARLLFVLLTLLSASFTDVATASNAECGLSEFTALTHQFDSGAQWSFCWKIDNLRGLEIANVYYGAPNESPRQLLDSASIAQILFKYDADRKATAIIGESGLGDMHVAADRQQCTHGQIRQSLNQGSICTSVQDINTLTRVRRSASLRRHQLSIHAWSQFGNHFYKQQWQFSEDGELTPSMHMAGTISRFTSDARYGVEVHKPGDALQQALTTNDKLFAASASILTTWRLTFAIAGTAHNDIIEEFNFIEDGTSPNKRSLEKTKLHTEQFRRVNRRQFRAWHIRDSTISAGPAGTTKVGYYLDPQSSGHSYIAPDNRWAEYALAITNAKACEQLASNNQYTEGDCSHSLSGYVNSESLVEQPTALWFSIARHFLPSREDYPAIVPIESAFKIQPFDWSAQTPFSAQIR